MKPGKLAPYVVAVVAAVVIAILIFRYPTTRESDPRLETAARQLSVQFGQRIGELSAAYKKGDPVQHLRATLSALRLINRTSIRALLPELDKLEKAISKEELAPYVAIAMEIAHRLGRNRHATMQGHFSRLAEAALAKAGEAGKKKTKTRFLVLVREKGKRSYRKYDENTGRAVARLAFSEFGRAQFQRGQWPADLVRTAAMFWECRHNEEIDDTRSPAAKKACLQFVGIVADKLEQSGQGGITPQIGADLGPGTLTGALDCLTSERAGQELIETFETFSACMANEAANPSQWHLDGSSISSNWGGETPPLAGYETQGSTEEVFNGPNGNTGTQVTHSYKNNSGGTVTVTDYSVIVNGEEDSGTHTVTDDGQGNTHVQHQDAQGNVTSSFTNHANGNTDSFQKTNNGGSVKVSTNADTGVSTVEVTDAQGATSTATVDADGNCTGSACGADVGSSASTPVDDTGWAPACSMHPDDPRVADNGLTSDPLGPYIYPSPDSSSGHPAPFCAPGNVASSTSDQQCPPSVALCLEPPPFGSCTCGGARNDGPIPGQTANTCNQIQCGEGSQCDPATGVCGSMTVDGKFGGFSPGLDPPLPPPVLTVPR